MPGRSLSLQPSLGACVGWETRLLQFLRRGGWVDFLDVLGRLWVAPCQRMPSGWLNNHGEAAENQVTENCVGQGQHRRDRGPPTTAGEHAVNPPPGGGVAAVRVSQAGRDEPHLDATPAEASGLRTVPLTPTGAAGLLQGPLPPGAFLGGGRRPQRGA